MRKMADAFVAVRRAELVSSRASTTPRGRAGLPGVRLAQFTDDEFFLCPPLIVIGGDGAMLDIGFQNLSRLFASGKPIRVLVLDTQVYSNTGGQACTSGFTGQVADMSAYGAASHGKQETGRSWRSSRWRTAACSCTSRRRRARRTSWAASCAACIRAGRRSSASTRRARSSTGWPTTGRRPRRLALESRAFPFLTFDPDAGRAFADALARRQSVGRRAWPTYTLEYVAEDGAAAKMELPLTIADWAATETRFRKHFSPKCRPTR
jgi:pyruvate-ferredoxin/flavodoxin oxidoreductase